MYGPIIHVVRRISWSRGLAMRIVLLGRKERKEGGKGGRRTEREGKAGGKREIDPCCGGNGGESRCCTGARLVRSRHSPETPCMYQVHRCAVPSHARCYVVFESISTTLSSEKSGTSNVQTWDVDAIPHGAF